MYAEAAAARPTWAGAGDIDKRADAYAGRDGAVEAGGQDVREHGEVTDLLHGLCLVGEADEVEVGVGHHDVVGLATYPAAHVDVAVGATGAAGVHVEADTGVLRAARLAASAGDVEGNGDEIADVEVLDVGALLDDLAGDLVAENHAARGRGAATHHVLIGAADVGRDHFEDDGVLDLLACRVL